MDYTPLHRAALENLDRWVSSNEPPPPSRHPSITDGTAVESKTVLKKFTQLPSVSVPQQTTRAIRLDYGPETALGRTTVLPALEGAEYPALVSEIDDTFNEIAGIRLPDLTVPVGTYTGWNLRHPDIGNTVLFIGITGGLAGWTLPLSKTREDREGSRDPRFSITELYSSRKEYLRQVTNAAETLVTEGYLLTEDVTPIVDRAAWRYDYFLQNGN